MTDGFKNEIETLAHDPRKLPPWHLTGLVVAYRGLAGRSHYSLRERWDNVQTGEVELRATTMTGDMPEPEEEPPKVDKTRPWWAGGIFR